MTKEIRIPNTEFGYRFDEVKIRKKRKCHHCRRLIKKGETAHRWTKGRFYHPKCARDWIMS